MITDIAVNDAARRTVHDHPPPTPAIARKGIAAIETSLKPGQTIALPPGLVATLWGKELLAHFSRTADLPHHDNNSEETPSC